MLKIAVIQLICNVVHILFCITYTECVANETLPVNGSAENEDKVDLPLDSVDLDNYIELCTDRLDLEVNDTIRNITRSITEICSEFTIDTGEKPCNGMRVV